MLTQDELQQLGTLIETKLEAEREQTRKLLEPINTRLAGVEKNLVIVQSDVIKVKKDVSILIRSTNRDDMNLMKRVERIEHHLGLSPMH